MYQLRRHRGFTMVELIVAIVVVAILGSIAIVGYRTVISNASDAAAEETLRSFHREVSALAATDGDCDPTAANVTDAGGDLPDGWTLSADWSDAPEELSAYIAAGSGACDDEVGYAVVSGSGNCVMAAARTTDPLPAATKSPAASLGAAGCSGATATNFGGGGPIGTIPADPVVADVNNNSTTVGIDWDPVAHPYLTGYRVYNADTDALLNTLPSGTTNWDATSLTVGTKYSWDLESYTSAGASNKVNVSAVARPPLTKIVGDGVQSCGLGNNGTVWCWGNGSAGQNGNGSSTHRSYPVQVTGISTATDIAGSGQSNCAILADKTARCWGANGSGQLGNGISGAFQQSNTPQTVCAPAGCGSGALTNIEEIVTGYGYIDFSTPAGAVTCARLTSGAVYCWGADNLGQTGDGTSGTGHSVPKVAVGQAAAGVTDLGIAGATVCGVKAGSVYCWGRNTLGTLGAGGAADSPTHAATPVAAVGINTASSLAHNGTGQSMCALLSAGTVSCWGYNHNGHLGDGTTTTRTAPVAATQFGSGVTQITVGGNGSCALYAAGNVKCVGANYSGQLGTGVVSPTSTACPAGANGTDLLDCAYSVVALDADIDGVTQVFTGSTAFGNGRTCVIAGGRARCVGERQFGGTGNENVVDVGGSSQAAFEQVW